MAEKWIVCRICLQQPNETMLQIFDVDASKDMTQMILECGGVPIKQFDHYPDKICSKCLKYLRMAYKFRETCQRSYKHLSRFIAPVEVESKNIIPISGRDQEPEVIVPSTHDIENDDDETNQSGISGNLQAVPIDYDGEQQYVVHLREDNNITVNNVKEEYQDQDMKFQDDEIVGEVVDGVVDIYAPMDDDDFEEVEDFETMDRDGSNITEVVEYLDDIGDHLSSDDEYVPKRPGNFSKVPRGRGRPPKSEGSPKKIILKASNGRGITNLPAIKREKYKRQSKYDESGQLKSFICDVCGNTYPTQGRLREHIKSHNGLKPHECEICGHAFAQNQQLARHMNTHTGNRPYKCQYCPSAFADLSTRNKHHRIHTNERPYVCDVCGKAFAYTNTLKFHKMIHTGEKPFVCDICGKGFHQAYKLRNHKATHEKRGVKREKLDDSLIELYNEATDGNSQISEM